MTTERDTIDAWHLAGQHVCCCRYPDPRSAGVFDVQDCATCGRLVMPIDTAAELLVRVGAAS